MIYQITQNFINKNRSYQPLSPQGAVCHETATPGATALAERNYFSNNDVKANAHAFVDYAGTLQLIPWNELGWGAGYTANHKFLQIELCHFDGDKFTEIWNRGVWTFAWLFINVIGITTITPDNLMSHQEVSEKWGETDHTDPYGFFLDNGKTFDDFRSAVQKEINSQSKGVDDMKVGMDVAGINVVMNGEAIDKTVLLNVDGKDTTYIPAVALRDVGIAVTWDASTSTVIITK